MQTTFNNVPTNLHTEETNRNLTEDKNRNLTEETNRNLNDQMQNYLIRATAADDFIRAFAVTCRDVTEEARQRHNLSPVTTAALGRVMAAALMMGIDLKNDKDMLTIQYDCDGPAGGITVTADSHGHVKGYVNNPEAMLPANAIGKLDVGGIVGKGLVRVMKDIGLKDAYNGTVEIQSGEIGEDLAYYFAVSEQIPSVVSLGVLVDTEDYHVLQTGGFIIQLMPGCPDEIADALDASCRALPQITTLLREGGTPETILEKVLGAYGLRIHEKKPVSFQCDCSRQRVEKALLAMGDVELYSLIKEGKPVTLNCGFCNADYTFSVAELEELRKRGKN